MNDFSEDEISVFRPSEGMHSVPRPKPQYALEQFDYDLPEELIAQEPAVRREEARLLVLNRKTGAITHSHFSDIPRFFDPGDLIILNNTKVIQARFYGRKETGGKIEFLFLREEGPRRIAALIKGKVQVGDQIAVYDPFKPNGPKVLVKELRSGGERLLELQGFEVSELFRLGHPPLPPYIRREWGETRPDDQERYQTIFASEMGAVAAPTAGLHFTRDIFSDLATKAVCQARVTLHVGAGTFKPIERPDYENHPMHAEHYFIGHSSRLDLETRPGRRIAVGTTTVRALETFRLTGKPEGWTDLFLYPPQEILSIDALITNFHLPKSTLLMLVASFAGLEKLKAAYQEAVALRYRFFSFGDAMLIV